MASTVHSSVYNDDIIVIIRRYYEIKKGGPETHKI